MQKRILSIILAPCLSLLSCNVMALNCGGDASQNIVSSNNYIFQILNYIDSPVDNIKKETRTAITKDDNNTPIVSTTHVIEYDQNGQITQSKYDFYFEQNKRVYSEYLHKTKLGWENIIEDAEDKTTSVIEFNADEQGRIIKSQQLKKALDFIFIETDNYQYDDNNCLISKNVKWKLKETDEKGKLTGVNQEGSSVHTFEYKDEQLAHVLYDFSNKTKSDTRFSYQYDDNKRLSTIYTTNLFGDKDKTEYITQFLSFNDKQDWLTASKIRKDQPNKHTDIVRELTYY